MVHTWVHIYVNSHLVTLTCSLEGRTVHMEERFTWKNGSAECVEFKLRMNE